MYIHFGYNYNAVAPSLMKQQNTTDIVYVVSDRQEKGNTDLVGDLVYVVRR